MNKDKQMNRPTYRRRKTRHHRKSCSVRFFLFLTICMIVVCSFVFGVKQVRADQHKEAVNVKCYKSIEIQSGDTLWSIAESYHDASRETVGDYMRELIEINQIDTIDHIQEGDFLMIPYFEEC